MLYGDELVWNAFGQLSRVVANGKSAFEQLHGQSFYGYLGEHPTASALFNDAMTGFSEQEAGAILEAYDFSAVRAIVDVGGGQGALMAALLHAHAPLHAVIFDRSPPTDDTRRLFERLDILGRAEFVQGDFFATIPQGRRSLCAEKHRPPLARRRCDGHPAQLPAGDAAARSPAGRGTHHPAGQRTGGGRLCSTST